MEWNLSTDVVVIGAGAAGLAAAVSARDHGAAVIVVEENYDIGGHAMLSGGRVQLGGGNALQKKFGVEDSPDNVFDDWVNFKRGDARYNDRDLVRTFADECVPTFQFLLDNGVTFIEKPIITPDAATVPRVFVTHEWHIASEVIAPRRNRNGSGLVRRLAESARSKGAQILLKHEMTQIVREDRQGRVLGIVARADGKDIAIEAKKGVVIATGGHTGNVNFRRMFDPRLTEEYQQAGMPYSVQGADGELAAMDIGASLWATGTQTAEVGPAITKTRHVGCRWGYLSLYYEPDSPIFHLCKATGLTVTDWHEAILVKQNGKRFWNELDSSYAFINAALAYSGDAAKPNGGGPIWAIFDADAVARQKWKPEPPHVDPDGYFFKRRYDFRAGRQDQEPVPEAAHARRSAARDGEPLQCVRRRRRGRRLRQADAFVQNREAAVLCGLVDADPARHVDRASHRYFRAGRRYPRRDDPGALLRGRIPGRLCPTWAWTQPGIRPHRGAARGATQFVRGLW